MYTVLAYSMMALDRVRMSAYERAIEQLVKPGSVVLDIGAGTGILSLLAARAGARRVIAVEPNPAVQLLPLLAKENGLADRIEVHRAKTSDITLDEPADVVVSDLRGAFPLHEAHLDILRDARARLLKPSGVITPKMDELRVAGFESESAYQRVAAAWKPFDQIGLSSKTIRHSAVNATYFDHERMTSNEVVTTAETWGRVVYGEAFGESVEGTVKLRAIRPGTLHGLACWFRATVADGISYENAPGSVTAYSRVLLPLEEPVTLREDDEVEVTMRVSVRGDRWAWDTSVGARRFRQSTFLGNPTALEDLMKLANGHRPTRNKEGEALLAMLASLDGKGTIDDLVKTHPAIRDIIRDYGR